MSPVSLLSSNAASLLSTITASASHLGSNATATLDDFPPLCPDPKPPIPHPHGLDAVLATLTRFEQVTLNPQPLPPKAAFDDGDWCATVPKHFPHPSPAWSFGDLLGGAPGAR